MKNTETTPTIAEAVQLGIQLGAESTAESIIDDLNDWVDEIEDEKTADDGPLSIPVIRQRLLLQIIRKIDKDYN